MRHEDPADDAGGGASEAFVHAAEMHLLELQPAADERTRSSDAAAVAQTNVHLGAELPDGREVNVDAISTRPHVREETVSSDAWYGAGTPSPDVVIHAGHAGLGENVRALAKKGVYPVPAAEGDRARPADAGARDAAFSLDGQRSGEHVRGDDDGRRKLGRLRDPGASHRSRRAGGVVRVTVIDPVRDSA